MNGYINKTLAYEHCHTINYNQHEPWDTLVQTATCTELPEKFCALYCSEIALPSTDGLTHFCVGVIAPLKWQNPYMNFSSSFMPIDLRSSVPTSYYPSSQRLYDGRDHILFYDKHGDRQTRRATNSGKGRQTGFIGVTLLTILPVSVSGYTGWA
jgi:hypothetical protein